MRRFIHMFGLVQAYFLKETLLIELYPVPWALGENRNNRSLRIRSP